ncbi:MAG: DUF4366 domain-containing protein [Lachnospiraceae bacterium]|nr:DUF4366 domain-containing protein [Lachnospiraceae bacterium]
MTNKITNTIAALVCIVACFTFQMPVYASDGQEYITISVDAVDENGNLKYALDTDDPSAFTDSNEFVVPAGTSHTIYVKDGAGNISSQVYPTEDMAERQYVSNDATEEDGQRININLELGDDTSEPEDYEITGSPAEPGSASVSSKIKTDGSDSAEKVFYTFTTKEGETLYLVIDQAQSSDNVYLLDTVSLGDLKVLADGQTTSYGATDEGGEDNLLSALAASSLSDETDDNINEQTTKQSGRSPFNSNAIVILIFAVVGGGAYYYIKVYKNKKDEAMDAMDAMDMDEFEPEEEEEELEFDYDDAEKERYLDELLDEDEALYDADPEEYATSHIDDEDYDNGIELDEDEIDISGDDGEMEE